MNKNVYALIPVSHAIKYEINNLKAQKGFRNYSITVNFLMQKYKENLTKEENKDYGVINDNRQSQ